MTDLNPSFVAHASHPSFGEAVADGRIIIDHYDLQFLSAGVELRIPLNRLEIALADEGGGVFFSDSAQPDWSVYTFDGRILQDIYLTRNANTRIQLKSFRSRGELRSRLKITLWVLGGFAAVAIGVTLFISIAIRVLVSKIPPKFEQDLGALFNS